MNTQQLDAAFRRATSLEVFEPLLRDHAQKLTVLALSGSVESQKSVGNRVNIRLAQDPFGSQSQEKKVDKRPLDGKLIGQLLKAVRNGFCR